MKHVVTSMAAKWDKSYAETCAFVTARLLFAMVRASSLCLRGSRVKWRSGLGFDVDVVQSLGCVTDFQVL